MERETFVLRGQPRIIATRLVQNTLGVRDTRAMFGDGYYLLDRMRITGDTPNTPRYVCLDAEAHDTPEALQSPHPAPKCTLIQLDFTPLDDLRETKPRIEVQAHWRADVSEVNELYQRLKTGMMTRWRDAPTANAISEYKERKQRADTVYHLLQTTLASGGKLSTTQHTQIDAMEEDAIRNGDALQLDKFRALRAEAPKPEATQETQPTTDETNLVTQIADSIHDFFLILDTSRYGFTRQQNGEKIYFELTLDGRYFGRFMVTPKGAGSFNTFDKSAAREWLLLCTQVWGVLDTSLPEWRRLYDVPVLTDDNRAGIIANVTQQAKAGTLHPKIAEIGLIRGGMTAQALYELVRDAPKPEPQATPPATDAPKTIKQEAEERLMARGTKVTPKRIKREIENIQIEVLMDTHSHASIAEELNLDADTIKTRIANIKKRKNSP